MGCWVKVLYQQTLVTWHIQGTHTNTRTQMHKPTNMRAYAHRCAHICILLNKHTLTLTVLCECWQRPQANSHRFEAKCVVFSASLACKHIQHRRGAKAERTDFLWAWTVRDQSVSMVGVQSISVLSCSRLLGRLLLSTYSALQQRHVCSGWGSAQLCSGTHLWGE